MNHLKYGWTRRLYQQGQASRFFMKVCKNFYYYTVRKGKCKCSGDLHLTTDKVHSKAEKEKADGA